MSRDAVPCHVYVFTGWRAVGGEERRKGVEGGDDVENTRVFGHQRREDHPTGLLAGSCTALGVGQPGGVKKGSRSCRCWGGRRGVVAAAGSELWPSPRHGGLQNESGPFREERRVRCLLGG